MTVPTIFFDYINKTVTIGSSGPSVAAVSQMQPGVVSAAGAAPPQTV